MAGGLVGNFVSDSLPEQPSVKSTSGGKLGQLVTDVYTAVPDAHSQNVFPREIGEKNLIIRKPVLIFADRDNLRRLVSHQPFDWVIRNGGNTHLR